MSKLKNAAILGAKVITTSSNYRIKAPLMHNIENTIANFAKTKNEYQKIFEKFAPTIGNVILNETHRNNIIELGKIVLSPTLENQEKNLLIIDKACSFLKGIVEDKQLIQDLFCNEEIIIEASTRILKNDNIKKKLKYLGCNVEENDTIIVDKLVKFAKCTLELMKENNNSITSMIDEANNHLKLVISTPNVEHKASKLIKKIAPDILDIASHKEFIQLFDAATNLFPNSVFSADLRRFGISGTHFCSLAINLKPNYIKNERKDKETKSLLSRVKASASDYLEDQFEARYISDISPPNITPTVKNNFF